jgi:hypothetical protein
MLPIKGKEFPKRDGKGSTALGYAGAIATALRAELGGTHQAIKTVMRWTGACERTAKNWLSGTRGPAGEHLIALLRNSDTVLEAVLGLSERQASARVFDLVDARAKLREMVQRFDDLLDPSA